MKTASPPLFLTEPWREHRFPHKRIARKACVAKSPYRCDSLDGSRPPDCAGTLGPGVRYLRVSLKPDPRSGGDRWRTVRLCRACAVHLGLASDTMPAAYA